MCIFFTRLSNKLLLLKPGNRDLIQSTIQDLKKKHWHNNTYNFRINGDRSFGGIVDGTFRTVSRTSSLGRRINDKCVRLVLFFGWMIVDSSISNRNGIVLSFVSVFFAWRHRWERIKKYRIANANCVAALSVRFIGLVGSQKELRGLVGRRLGCSRCVHIWLSRSFRAPHPRVLAVVEKHDWNERDRYSG